VIEEIPTEVLRRVWPDGVDSAEPLGGGITNHNFKVFSGGETYVLRIGGNDTELLGIDRQVEHTASVAAAALGIGPQVIAFIEPEGYLVTQFIEGEVGRVSIEEAASLLRRCHAGPPIAGAFDAFRVVKAYADEGRVSDSKIAQKYTWAKELADRIEARRGAIEARPCHNDLLAGNFVHDGERPWIVDWEYAGMGDPAFDLANFAVSNSLDDDGDRTLLEVYGGADYGAHILMRFMSDFREAMWGVVQQVISQLDFDFSAYAAEHFERLEQTAAEPRFRRALIS
jgi:thiamine kinase-like enzyme